MHKVPRFLRHMRRRENPERNPLHSNMPAYLPAVPAYLPAVPAYLPAVPA